MKIDMNGLDGVSLKFDPKAQKGHGGLLLRFVDGQKKVVFTVDLCLEDAETFAEGIVRIIRAVEEGARVELDDSEEG